MKANHFLYPTVDHGLQSKFIGRKQGPVYPSFLHSTTHGSSHVGAGNSFLSLLCGPPSLLQCDFQELSDRKLCTSSINCTVDIGNSVVDSTGSGTSPTAGGGLITENLTNCRQPIWSNTHPEFSSRAMFGLGTDNNFVFDDIQSSSSATQPTVLGGEEAKESFSSLGQSQGAGRAFSLNGCSSEIQATPHISLEQCLSEYAAPFISASPRVFCMEKSGYLLLSNTGIPGIVCSCHCFHMSVLKFCEHSGLHGVNPGDAVRMESGETISKWQKLYFSKFGIRFLENESEWDWPEVLSTTGSLMKSNVSSSDMSKTDLSDILSSSAVVLRSGKSSEFAMFTEISHKDRNLFNGAMFRKQPTITQDGCNIPLNGYAGFSENSLYDPVKNQLMEFNLGGHTSAPNFVGTQLDGGCQPTSPFLDSLKRKGNLSTNHFPLQTSTGPLKDHEHIIKKNPKDGLVDRDAAFASVELRLGQPPQTGNLIPSFIEPSPFNTLACSPELQPQKQTIKKLRREKELQNNFSYAAGSFKMAEEQPQLKHMNCMSAVGNTSGAACARSETNIVAKDLLFSPFSQFDNQCMERIKFSENLMNDSEPNMLKKLHSDFSTTPFDFTNVPWNSGHTGQQSNNFAQGTNKYLDKDKQVTFAKGFCAKTNSGFGVGQLMEYPSSIMRAVGGSDCCFPVVKRRMYESSLPSDASVVANYLHGSSNVSSFGQLNHVNPETTITFKGISKGLPCLASSSASNKIPTSLQQQLQSIDTDVCLLDENMRLLALTQILELSKLQHALYFRDVNMNNKQGRSSNISKAPQNMYEASTSEQGLNKYCCWSRLAPIHLHSKENESQCKHSYDIRNEEPSLSLGINKDNTRSSACEKCSDQPLDIHFGEQYTRAGQINCCQSNYFSGVDSFRFISKQQFANVNVESSLKIASDLSGDLYNSNDHFEQGGKLDCQNSIKICSRTPQWRDVPSKVRNAVCDAKSIDQAATGLDWKGKDGVQLGNHSLKCFKTTIDMGDLWKEHENSNVSSGSSAPVVTQTPVEINKVGSCTVNAVCNVNYLVDEGSGVDQGWLSDVGSERSAEFSTCGNNLKNGCLRDLDDQPCHSLVDELKILDSLIWKKDRDQSYFVHLTYCKSKESHKVKKGIEGKKRKRNEVRIPDASLSSGIPSLLDKKNGEGAGIFNSSSCSAEELPMQFLSSLQRSSMKPLIVQPSNKQRYVTVSTKFLPCKNQLNKDDNDEARNEPGSNSEAALQMLPQVSGTKKVQMDFASDCFGKILMQEPAYEKPGNAKVRSFSCMKENAHRIRRPVVCGNYGEISGGKAGEVPVKAKIVSLSKVIEASKRCMLPMNGKLRLISKKKWKRLSIGTSSGLCCRNLDLKTKEDNEIQNTIVSNEKNVDGSMEELERGGKPPVINKGKKATNTKVVASIANCTSAPVKVKSKEIRKQRSINELTAKAGFKCLPETEVNNSLNHAEDGEHGLCSAKFKNCIQDHTSICIKSSDVFCCVCQSSSNDVINCLLECSRCLIRVHQACYGIFTLPKNGRWCCRPCRTNSEDIACVLCGYGGGAMTRAILSHTIVKSLLKVWNVEEGRMPKPKRTTSHEVFDMEVHAFKSSKSGLKIDQECVLRPGNNDTSAAYQLKSQMSKNHMQHTPSSVSSFRVHNSITAGVLDPNVKQWVHMVCGLWTPGTRCPNVDTMSAFDVSCVLRPRADVVCSICNRWGGSCIECRAADCSVKFHPWCAHQKNLLQCEAEGVDDEKIGFYGKCVLHADPRCQSTHDPIDEMGIQEEKDSTCAREEGYEGRGWDGFQNNHYRALKTKGCLVPEEQLNAWIHINGQKFCSKGLPKFPDLDIEHDCRREYSRYKQAKGWKNLVVYKSRIHGLGLYTARFISRGAMVVEYVGEIVRLHVADKRENEYQSGRKLKYKSACYFFRIDKEHIIDATRKGGIARFVNHSCLPNCVAKVITIRHEKKVVFFAERDIFPGEEITYDYHFNNEDEGKKIPCYCNSKSCRRYMN